MPTVSPAPAMGIRDEVAALKRERTISVASDLFYGRGYENTTLDAVAEQLGVTKPFIYAHFSSKTELLAEICSRGIASALGAIDSVLMLERTATERLREFVHRFVTAVLENQKHIAIFAREEKNLQPEDFERISDMRRDFDRKLVSLLSEGVESGEFRIGDPQMAALAIGGMVSWAYVWYRPNGRLTLREVAEEMTRLVLSLAGVAAAREAARPPAARAPRAKKPGTSTRTAAATGGARRL